MTFMDANKQIGPIDVILMERVSSFIVAVATFVMLLVILAQSKCGFEFTDEGLYALSMANPWANSASLTQFGFIYHPLYNLAHGSISIIRMTSYLITFCLAWILCIAFYLEVCRRRGTTQQDWFFLICVSAAVASSSLLVSDFELAQSPSYNTLTIQSMLFGMIGVVFAESDRQVRRVFGHILIGASLWLISMAKPSSALLFGLVGIVYFLVISKFRLKLLAVSAVVAIFLLLFSVYAIDGSVSGFVARIKTGLAMRGIIGGAPQVGISANTLFTIWRWEPFPLEGRHLELLLLFAGVNAAVILSSASANKFLRGVGLIVSVTCAFATISIFIHGYSWNRPDRYDGLIMLALPLSCVFAAAITNGLRFLTRHDLAFAIVLLVLPFIYAFGTDRPYWLNAQGAMFFWFLSGTVLVSVFKTRAGLLRALLTMSSTAALMTAVFVAANLEYPMRQTVPLRLDDKNVIIGESSQLRVAGDTAAYIEGLQQLARIGAFRSGTPIIDLSGHSPGAVYTLNGNAPGAMWLPGGYTGSRDYAVAALDLATCDQLAQAWIIIEPSGPGPISPDILERYGIDVEHDYQDLGIAETPIAPFPISYAQHLLKPRRTIDESRAVCELKRRDRAN
jgi:hypothetical protein